MRQGPAIKTLFGHDLQNGGDIGYPVAITAHEALQDFAEDCGSRFHVVVLIE